MAGRRQRAFTSKKILSVWLQKFEITQKNDQKGPRHPCSNSPGGQWEIQRLLIQNCRLRLSTKRYSLSDVKRRDPEGESENSLDEGKEVGFWPVFATNPCARKRFTHTKKKCWRHFFTLTDTPLITFFFFFFELRLYSHSCALNLGPGRTRG